MIPLCYFRKCIRNFRDYGILVVVKKILLSFLSPIYRMQAYHIYKIDLGTYSDGDGQDLPGYSFRFITPEDTQLIAQIEHMEEWLKDKIHDKLIAGHRCLVCLHKETVAGFNLVGFDCLEIPLVKIDKKLRKGECASEQISVHPKYRSAGIGTKLRQILFTTLHQEGYKRLYGGTQALNVSNKALSRKVGLKDFAVARYSCVFGRERLVVSRMPH